MVAARHEYAALWHGCSFAFDEQFGGQQLLQRLEKEIPGSRFFAFPQQPQMLCAAAMGFAELVSTGKLHHPGHRQLTDHVLNAAARFVGERWRFAKQRGRPDRWIDGLIAAAIAVDVVGRFEPPRQSVYESIYAAG
jgi:hypothetical protein